IKPWLLCALLLCALLLALRGNLGRAAGYCHGWAGGTQRCHRGFQCLERHDSPEARCSAPEARLDQSLCPGERQPGPRPPAAVPVYLPFLLVSSVFVAFVAGGACIGICCCKCLKSQDDEQQSGLAPGQTWLLEPNLPPHLSSSAPSSATRSSLRSEPQPRNICMALAPSLPIIGLSEEARILSSSSTKGQLLHPIQASHSHRMPPDHITLMAPASFLKRPYGHSTDVCPISVMQDD
uniref:Uncharacterized protein n=1 Tax=Phasianus colchicus TaxID=9054 RepID=A0A669Q1R1_PHACC